MGPRIKWAERPQPTGGHSHYLARLAQAEISQTQTTAHYTVKLTVGPVATMLMPSEAAGANEGYVGLLVLGGLAAQGGFWRRRRTRFP